MEPDRNRKVNCLKCKHFTVTWNPQFPNACKLLGFKSASMPSTVAYNTTGKICEGFELKSTHKANAGDIRENANAVGQSVIVSIGSREERR